MSNILVIITSIIEFITVILGIKWIIKNQWRIIVTFILLFISSISFFLYHQQIEITNIITEQRILKENIKQVRSFTYEEVNILINQENEILSELVTKCNNYNNNSKNIIETRYSRCSALRLFVKKVNNTHLTKLSAFRMITCTFTKNKKSNEITKNCLNIIGKNPMYKKPIKITDSFHTQIKEEKEFINNLEIVGCQGATKEEISGLRLLDVLDFIKELDYPVDYMTWCANDGVMTLLTQVEKHDALSIRRDTRLSGCTTPFCLEETYKASMQINSWWHDNSTHRWNH